MDGKPLSLQLGSSYPVIAGCDEQYIDFCAEKGLNGCGVYIHTEEQVREMKNGTIIYKGYGYLDSSVLDIDVMRKRILLGEITFKDWID